MAQPATIHMRTSAISTPTASEPPPGIAAAAASIAAAMAAAGVRDVEIVKESEIAECTPSRQTLSPSEIECTPSRQSQDSFSESGNCQRSVHFEESSQAPTACSDALPASVGVEINSEPGSVGADINSEVFDGDAPTGPPATACCAWPWEPSDNSADALLMGNGNAGSGDKKPISLPPDVTGILSQHLQAMG